MIDIIGCGPGAADLITLRGQAAILSAEVLVGSPRLIKTFATGSTAETISLESNYGGILDRVASEYSDQRVTFLVSGDPLFYSLGELLLKRFGAERCNFISGISSLQYAATREKRSWKNLRLVSIHGGENKKESMRPTSRLNGEELRDLIKSSEEFSLLLGIHNHLPYIKEVLGDYWPENRSFFIASDLSLPGEKVATISYGEFDDYPLEPLALLIVRNRE